MRASFASLLGVGCIVTLSHLTSVIIFAQGSRATQGGSTRSLQVSVDLTVLDVTVHDHAGKPVRDLEQGRFKVYEDKVEQTISFLGKEESPVTWGLVLDRSGSMQGMMSDVYEAALHILQEGIGEDEMFIMTFGDQINLVSPLTSDRRKLQDSIFGLRAHGPTPLFDAVASALDYIKQGKHRKKVLVVVTDGGDNYSLLSFNRLVNRVRESDVLIYAVGMYGTMAHNPTEFRLIQEPRRQLEQLAETTGGYAYFPIDPDKCRETMSTIVQEVSEHYTIGYYSTNQTHDGSWRKIKVEVTTNQDRTKYFVRTRSGYYAPRLDAAGPSLPLFLHESPFSSGQSVAGAGNR